MSIEDILALQARIRRLDDLRGYLRLLMVIPLGLSLLSLIVQVVTGHWSPDGAHLRDLGWFALFAAGLIALCHNLIRLVDRRIGRYQEQAAAIYASLPDTVPLDDQARMQRTAAAIVAFHRRRPRLLRQQAVADRIDRIERFALAMDRHDGPSDAEITVFHRDELLPMERQVRTIRAREQLLQLLLWYLIAVLIVAIVFLLLRGGHG